MGFPVDDETLKERMRAEHHLRQALKTVRDAGYAVVPKALVSELYVSTMLSDIVMGMTKIDATAYRQAVKDELAMRLGKAIVLRPELCRMDQTVFPEGEAIRFRVQIVGYPLKDERDMVG